MSNTKDYGQYTLIKKLATGGMAEVFLARKKGMEGFEKLCVVKRILPHLADDAEFVTMFLNEARIAARFNHPNICTIFDLGKEEGTYYIAMEYIHGEDLGRIMRQAWHAGTWLPVPITLRIIANACEGLHYAHAKTDERGQPLKVVHRDVSPQNVLVAFEGNAKIVDFGIARAADQVSTTRSGSIKGKFAYMSPEQASGKALDHRSDQFAIGLVLYELLTGVRPFKRESDILTLKAAVDCEIPPPSAVAEVPKAFDEIAMRALSKMAEDRYPDTRGLQLAIDNFITGQGWTVSNAHVTEFMSQLFSDRLLREAETGEPQVSDSQVGGVPASGSFPMPKRMPTRPEFLVAGSDGPPNLNPAALLPTGEAPVPEPTTGRRQLRPSSNPGVARRNTAERDGLVAPSARRASGIRPAAPAGSGFETVARPEPDRPAPPRRTASSIRKAAKPPEPELPTEVPEQQDSPARRRNTAQAARTATAERRRKSVLYLDEAEIAKQEAERREAARPTSSFLDDDDDDEEATTAQPRRERRPLPRWQIALVAVGALVALAMVPAVRVQLQGLLHAARTGRDDFSDVTNKTALFLESNVAVDVFRGAEKLGTTPLEGQLVPEGPLALRLSNTNLGIEKTIALQAKGSTLRHKEHFSVGRVRFRADKDCEVFIQGRRVARANGPPLDYFEGTYDTECRNEPLGLVARAKATVSKDRTRVADVSFKLQSMDRDPR